MPARPPWRLIAPLLLAAACGRPALAEDAPPGVAPLRDLLANGLKCRREDEFRFVDQVVARVEEGKLSRDMVKTIFIWARRKNSQFPFPYFERAMRMVAERLHVELDGAATAAP